MLANLLISQRFEGTGLVAAFNGLALLGKRCRGSNLVDAPLPEGAGGWDSGMERCVNVSMDHGTDLDGTFGLFAKKVSPPYPQKRTRGEPAR